MESYRVLVLSTNHLTEKDSEILEGLVENDGMVMSRYTGFFVKLYSEDGEEDGKARIHNCREEQGLSKDFASIMEYAAEMGYRGVEFDRDAEREDRFAFHSW